jgi:hypothetical protein
MRRFAASYNTSVQRNVGEGVASDWAFRNVATRIKLNEGGDVGISRNISVVLALLQRILMRSSFNLALIVDARVCLRRITSAHEVRNRDRSEEADDGHDDHDFNQREARLTGGIDLHICSVLSVLRRERSSRRVILIAVGSLDCLLQPR